MYFVSKSDLFLEVCFVTFLDLAKAVIVATKPPLSRSNRGRSHKGVVEPKQPWS